MKTENKNSVYHVERSHSLEKNLRKLFQNPRRILKPYISEGMTVLDLGCGPGFFSIEMARITGLSGKVVAADLQEGMLEIAEKKIKKKRLTDIVELHKCSEKRIGLAEKFDFILIFYVLHEVPDQSDFLYEVYSLLNPEGKILLVEPRHHVSQKEFDQLKEKLINMKFQIISEPKILLSRSYLLKKQLGKEYLRFADNVIRKVNPGENSTVLEIGPGPGWAGINLLKKRKDLKLVALEASPDMIRVASENAVKEGFPDIEFIPGFGENMLQINDGQYDLVISRDSLHHWEEPEKVFKEIRRVLKPAGKLYIQDFRRDMNAFGRLIVTIFSRFIPDHMGHYWRTSIAASYTPDEIKAMLSEIAIHDWMVESDLMDLIIFYNSNTLDKTRVTPGPAPSWVPLKC